MNLRLGVLTVGYGALLVYASLYPFAGWQATEVHKLAFLSGAWQAAAPRIDSYVNVLAYLPLGLLIALVLSTRCQFALRVILATGAGLALSFSMEFLQQYLPGRFASYADLATNTCGALFGALGSSFFDAERLPGRLAEQLRNQWVKPGPQFILALSVLAAWTLSQWLPGLPSFSPATLREGVAPAWHTVQDLSRFDVLQWARYALYLSGLALLVKTLANPGRPAVVAFFGFVAFVFAYKTAVMGRQLSLEALAGAFTAALVAGLWLALRVKTIAKVAAFFIFGGLVCAHLLPGADSAQHLSNWTPLRGPIDHPALGLGSVFEILWPAAALGYLVRIAVPPERQRAVAWGGGAALAVFLSAIDWHGRAVPIATGVLMGTTWTLFGILFSGPAPTTEARRSLLKKPAPSLAHGWVVICAAAVVALSCVEVWAADSSRLPLRVGPEHALKTPSAAATVARDGDVVEIEAGVYPGDAAVWTQNDLTLRGVGGLAQLRADGAHAEAKAIWVVKGANTTVENIEFSNAKVPDRNGAGIRLEGPGLLIRHCYFHHNENGILTAPHPQSDVTIEYSEFSHNGLGDGQTHNLYIGAVRTFTLRYSYVHHALIGHNVKSRALKNFIAHNRIMDERDGRSSYAIDLPDGGVAFVAGNVLHQGPRNDNRTLLAYGAEKYRHRVNELFLLNNTFVNDDPAGGRFIRVRSGAQAVEITDNIFSGPGRLPDGALRSGKNVRVKPSAFVDAANFDFRLKEGSPAAGRGAEYATIPRAAPPSADRRARLE